AGVVALGLLEPLEAHLGRTLETLDLGPPVLLVGGQRLLDLAVARERPRQRDRVLDRELRTGADREVGGVRRIAHEDDVAVAPGTVAYRREAAPERAVLQQPVALELVGEEPLEEGQGLVLV